VGVQILIPLKRLATVKQRLAPAATAAERERLMLSMLEHVAGAALASGVGPVSLASSEPRAGALAASLGVGLVTDGGLPWNEGLVHARELVGADALVGGVVFLAGDLPLLEPGDVSELVAATPGRGVAIGRAHDGGTNALVVRPADALDPSFGAPQSAAVHSRLAAAAGLEAVIVDRPGLALDVDTPDDVVLAGLRLPA
jgi:2-phospho-L-lactate guanylyltransferase